MTVNHQGIELQTHAEGAIHCRDARESQAITNTPACLVRQRAPCAGSRRRSPPGDHLPVQANTWFNLSVVKDNNDIKLLFSSNIIRASGVLLNRCKLWSFEIILKAVLFTIEIMPILTLEFDSF